MSDIPPTPHPHAVEIENLKGRVSDLEDHRDQVVTPTLQELKASDASLREAMRELERSLLTGVTDIKSHVSDTFVGLARDLLNAQPARNNYELGKENVRLGRDAQRGEWIRWALAGGIGIVPLAAALAVYHWLKAHIFGS